MRLHKHVSVVNLGIFKVLLPRLQNLVCQTRAQSPPYIKPYLNNVAINVHGGCFYLRMQRLFVKLCTINNAVLVCF